MWKAFQCLLHSANRLTPLSDWKTSYHQRSCRSGHSSIPSPKSPHDRFFCFKRGEPLISHSKRAPLLKADTPAYLRKLVRAKDQDGRVDTVSTSDLSRRPSDIDNEGTISQPDDQCRDKETNVDSDIRTLCEPPEHVEPVKESQASPNSPAPTLRRSAWNRKPPTYLGDFVLATN